MENPSIGPRLHVRRYFGAVAQPYPPPMTMTRPTGLEGAAGSLAQPGRSDVAAGGLEVFRQSRRVSRFMARSCLAFCAGEYPGSAAIRSSREPFATSGLMVPGGVPGS